MHQRGSTADTQIPEGWLSGARDARSGNGRSRGPLVSGIKEPHVPADSIIVAKVLTHRFSQRKQSPNNLRILIGNVGGFAQVIVEVDQERFVESNSISRTDVLILTKRRRSDGLFFSR